ncbi:ABC transporter substrate-binding protein [Anditalea andensis]|uniref:Leucine-binding protein domain-containing protein n=1 Tax=Anditalea andensis TaxID=1048983 RepID=A0A074L4S8_9BACT|nr:ABC transporter substrate-binding protein [Anditalea andensis]KEO74863.1 hypothetical protein EL17_04070 [Anditalea andensis]
MKKIFFIILLIVFSSDIYAQDDLQNYERGKKLVEYGNWQEAMEMLRPYMNSRQYGDLSHYAHFHFARAAYGNGQYELAKGALETVLDERRWGHTDEARYLLVLSHFNQEENEEALNEIKRLRDETLKDEAERATFDFLKNANLTWMISNLDKFQENKGYTLAIRNQLERKTVMSADERRVFQSIRTETSGGQSTARSSSNQTLDIALVLPFNYNGGSGVSRLQGGNFIFEYYKGLRLAVEKAKKEGMDVNLQIFDTERKPEVIDKILRDPFFQVADIIIGPVYPEETNIIAPFAELNKIPQVNPLSNLEDNIQGAEYSYLFRPSTSAMASGIIDYAVRRSSSKKIAIAYSGTSKDELLAKQVVSLAEQRGFQIVRNQKIDGKNTRDFFTDLGISRGRNATADIIVVLSDDPNVASPAFTVLESLNTHVPVVVPDSWLYFDFASFEMMHDQNVRFIGNNTINFEQEGLQKFRDDFYDKYQVYPGLYGHLGYETFYWVQQNLNSRIGFDFSRNLRRAGKQEGNISFGYNFANGRANQMVPILKLEDGILKIEQ